MCSTLPNPAPKSGEITHRLALLGIVPHAHAWPASALLLTLAYLLWPLDQERNETASRVSELTRR